MQPAGERNAVVHSRQRAERGQESLLLGVLGSRAVAEDRVGEPQGPALVAPEQLGERVLVAVQAACNKVSVIVQLR
jgi:hypothetical protein